MKGDNLFTVICDFFSTWQHAYIVWNTWSCNL